MIEFIDDDVEKCEWCWPEQLDDLDALSDREVGVRLATLISAISEEHYAAGWLMGVELETWAWAAPDFTGPAPYGLRDVDPDNIAALKRARERLQGGWVAWLDLPSGCGVYLLTAEEWAAERANGPRV